MPESATLTGGCHCGAVRYDVDTAIDTVISCNCSICRKRGSLLAFVTADKFRLAGNDTPLTDYQFNKKHVHHFFCPTCGVASFGRGVGPDGSEMVAINVRCLDDVDLDALKVMKFDGASL